MRFIPYNHFKIEGLQNLRYLLQEGDYNGQARSKSMLDLDLKIQRGKFIP